MKKFLALVALCGILLTSASHATETPSLFFTPQEIQTIEAPQAGAVPDAPADIHLGAVLYYGPNNWSVWLDGVKWTPETHRMDVQIIGVSPDSVRLQPQNAPTQPIVLRAHQTYQAATGKIVEGNP